MSYLTFDCIESLQLSVSFEQKKEIKKYWYKGFNGWFSTDSYYFVWCCRNNKLDYIKKIYKGQKETEIINGFKICCQFGFISIIKFLTEEFKYLKDNKIFCENACRNNKSEVVEYLVEQKFYISNLSIQYASQEYSLQIIKIIADHCNDKEILYHETSDEILEHLILSGYKFDTFGIGYLCKSNKMELLKMYKLEFEPDQYYVLYACKNNNLEMVKFLLKKGCNIHPDSINEACRYENLEMVKFLMSKTRGVNHLDAYKILIKDIEIIKCLIKYGFEFNEYDVENYISKNMFEHAQLIYSAVGY